MMAGFVMHPSDHGGAEPARATDSESDGKQFMCPGIH